MGDWGQYWGVEDSVGDISEGLGTLVGTLVGGRGQHWGVGDNIGDIIGGLGTALGTLLGSWDTIGTP